MALIDVIQHPSSRSDEIVYRVPQQGAGEFKFGSQLIVREGQAAVFFRDGKALDTFGPGRHTLSTNNLPLLTGIMGIPFGGMTPFTAEVFVVSLREFSDLRWGTAQPVVFATPTSAWSDCGRSAAFPCGSVIRSSSCSRWSVRRASTRSE
jgi:membrane protease subunit (stomatin/prohibitin family)